jgi:hypothetical protein
LSALLLRRSGGINRNGGDPANDNTATQQKNGGVVHTLARQAGRLDLIDAERLENRRLEDAMPRLCAPVGMILATLILGGCSSAHPIITNPADTTQWRLYRPGMATAPVRRVNAASRRPARVLARDTNDEALTTGTVAQSRALRPWPRVGTPEWFEIQRQDAERERRVQAAIRNICRGC